MCRCRNCKNPSCKFCIFPCVWTTSLKKVVYGDNAASDMLRNTSSPTRSQRKVVKKYQLQNWRSLHYFVVYPQDSYPKISVLGEPGMLGSRHAVKFSKSTWHRIKIRETTGPSRGIFQKCAPHERGPCAPKFEERSHEETLHQEGYARRASWDLGKIFTSSRMRTKLVLKLLLTQKWCQHLTQRDQRSANS